MKYAILPFIAFTCCILLPEQSMALQTHSEPEGTYVHQMAHILYITAMCYLYWDTKKASATMKEMNLHLEEIIESRTQDLALSEEKQVILRLKLLEIP